MNADKKKRNKRKNLTVEEKLEVIGYAELHGNMKAADVYGVHWTSVRLWRIAEDKLRRAKDAVKSLDFERVLIRENPIKGYNNEVNDVQMKDKDVQNDTINDLTKEFNVNLNEEHKNPLISKLIELLNGFKSLFEEHKCFKKSLINISETKRFEYLNNEFNKIVLNDDKVNDTHGGDSNLTKDVQRLSTKNDNEHDDNDDDVREDNEHDDESNDTIEESPTKDNDNEVKGKKSPLKDNLKSYINEENTKEIVIDYSQYELIDGMKYYRCLISQCEYKCQKKKTLKGHILFEHYGIRGYKCDFPNCVKTFKNQYTLSTHISTIHKNTQTFKCSWPGCEKVCSSERLIMLHYQGQHKRDKLYICDFPECNYKAYSQASLFSHKKIHRPKNLLCSWPGCDKKFRYLKSLKIHNNTHTGGRKRYVCDWPGCDYHTEGFDAMKGHKNKHLGIRNLDCPFKGCKKKFDSNKALCDHMITHREKIHACDWPGCEYRAYDLKRITDHRKTHIKPEVENICHHPGCGEKFVTHDRLRRHRRKHYKRSRSKKTVQ